MFAYPTFRNNNFPFANEKKPAVPEPELVSTVQDDGSFVRQPYKVHKNVNTTIQHWELRDLIRCPQKNIVLHPVNESICMYNTKTGQDQVVFPDLSFTPTSFDARYGYVAAAGQRGKAIVRNIATGWTSEFTAGRGINNSIHLSKTQDEIRVTVCNNDQTLCVYALPSMEKRLHVQLQATMNHASTSPDGSKLLVVADNGMGHVFDTADYKELLQVKASDEPAVSCAWNQSSELFTITSQDGLVHVWDILNIAQPLCKISSAETRKTRKVVRSIQFSKGPVDLLAYVEHVSAINIVDARTFRTRQIIRIIPTDMDHHITGLSFSPDNSKLFVGLEGAMIELDIDVCGRRQSSNPTNIQ